MPQFFCLIKIRFIRSLPNFQGAKREVLRAAGFELIISPVTYYILAIMFIILLQNLLRAKRQFFTM